jgi:hypothetical protein
MLFSLSLSPHFPSNHRGEGTKAVKRGGGREPQWVMRERRVKLRKGCRKEESERSGMGREKDRERGLKGKNEGKGRKGEMELESFFAIFLLIDFSRKGTKIRIQKSRKFR